MTVCKSGCRALHCNSSTGHLGNLTPHVATPQGRVCEGLCMSTPAGATCFKDGATGSVYGTGRLVAPKWHYHGSCSW